jgi:hypothetical protein
MVDICDQVSMLWNLAVADAAFPDAYNKLETAHPGIEVFLIHNGEVVAKWWATSVRAQVREIGWRLYAKGGTDTLILVADAMRGWGTYPEDLTEFAELVDTVWNGIGFEDDPRGIYKSTDELQDGSSNSAGPSYSQRR